MPEALRYGAGVKKYWPSCSDFNGGGRNAFAYVAQDCRNGKLQEMKCITKMANEYLKNKRSQPMAAEQLEELLALREIGGPIGAKAIVELREAAPSLACRVIAAEKLVDALMTVRDYVSDAKDGALFYDNGDRLSHTMSSEDLDRIDASLTAYREASE